MTEFEKLKKLDKYAKSLGMTIYDITYGFIKEDKLETLVVRDFNLTPEKTRLHPELKGIAQSI